MDNKISTSTVLNTKTIGLVKKKDYDTKISEIKKKITDHNHSKYITTQEFAKLMAENFKERLKLANFVSQIDFDNKLITSNKNKSQYLEVQKTKK